MQAFQRLQNAYRAYAAQEQFGQGQPQELYQPLDYILSLGGKQMRPILLLMAAELYLGQDIEAALPAAYAIELFHNFSLMHDDIMDQADLRRGKATVHKKFDTNTAILSGDVMLVYSYKYLAQSAAGNLPALLDCYNETAIGVCEGQQMDMNFEQMQSVALESYIKMIELKTSVLLYGAMKMGALIGQAPAEEAELLGEFGRNMGIAFQLQDDYLDSFGDAATFGKRIGGDILQNKKTVLYIKALELAEEADKQQLLALYQQACPNEKEEEKIETVKAIFERSGAKAALGQAVETYRLKAISFLDQLPKSSTDKAPLYQFLNFIMQRQH
ncbi:polyprenyl synthetase family protein [Saprospira sp. CCB-QB6]|uniref:polyprenyl synthetase family protein n=1 Tax=Saprospira sp. CCB-QB6 TaxID=3023936 RepID=UPI003FA68927